MTDPPQTEAVRGLLRTLFVRPDDTLARDALRDAYEDAGLSDADARARVAGDVREARAARWFRERSGFPRYSPRAAEYGRRFARAERWADDNGVSVYWEPDPDADRSWLDGPAGPPGGDDGRTLWRCDVVRPCGECGREAYLGVRCCGVYPDAESVGGVDFGPDGHPDTDPYARHLVAELTTELMPD